MSRLTNATALRTLDKFFEANPDINLMMMAFTYSRDGDRWHGSNRSTPRPLDVHDCGTAACAVGWAPTAGLTKHLNSHYDWERYSYMTFFHKAARGSEWPWLYLKETPLEIWGFLFSGNWDGSVDLLRERLQFVIKHDSVPDGWNYRSSPTTYASDGVRQLMATHGTMQPQEVSS